MLHYLNTGSIPSSVSHMFIILIPKVKSPTRVTEYCPIAPCNILYRLISKALANRLQKILPSVTFESQCAFQSNKSILDYILVTFMTLHHMNIQKSKNMSFMAMKLDMSKVYDRVEWKFLMKTMEKMDFCDKWVALNLECVITVSNSILVNGEPKGDIKPSRGIR